MTHRKRQRQRHHQPLMYTLISEHGNPDPEPELTLLGIPESNTRTRIHRTENAASCVMFRGEHHVQLALTRVSVVVIPEKARDPNLNPIP